MPGAFDLARTGFTVRPAALTDAKACRMLLPAMTGEAYWFVAVDGENQLAIGAAAMTRSRRRQPVVGPGVMIEVIEPCRRAGVGSALCDALLKSAAQQGSRALYAGRKVEYDGDEMLGWQRLRFEICETVEEHLLPLAGFAPRLAPLVEWFRKQGGIPQEAQIIPLHAANRADVLQLHLDHMGGDRESLYQRLSGRGAGAFHPRYSRVLLLGDRTVGCILAHRTSPHVAVVDANILAPEVRGGWANIWLKLEATEGAQSLGITHFQYTSFDHYADTRLFTSKLGGATTRKWALMYRLLRP